MSVDSIDTPPPPRYVTAAEVEATLGFAAAGDGLAAGLAARAPETLDPTPRAALDLPSERDAAGAVTRSAVG